MEAAKSRENNIEGAFHSEQRVWIRVRLEYKMCPMGKEGENLVGSANRRPTNLALGDELVGDLAVRSNPLLLDLLADLTREVAQA